MRKLKKACIIEPFISSWRAQVLVVTNEHLSHTLWRYKRCYLFPVGNWRSNSRQERAYLDKITICGITGERSCDLKRLYEAARKYNLRCNDSKNTICSRTIRLSGLEISDKNCTTWSWSTSAFPKSIFAHRLEISITYWDCLPTIHRGFHTYLTTPPHLSKNVASLSPRSFKNRWRQPRKKS